MKPTSLSLALLLVSASGCSPLQDDDACVGDRKLATNKLATNKLATNKLATNKLATNGILSASLPEVPLTSDSIATAVPAAAREDDFARSVLEYTVACALRPDQAVEIDVGGELVRLPGALGLAPAWGDAGGACDETCRGWVSACLLARTNILGVSRPISLLGDHPGLEPTADESAAFDVEEATYFGELFGPDKRMYACVPDGADGPERTCGEDAETCPIAVLGECSEVCDATGCRGADGLVYAQTVTVNLPSADCG